MLAHLWTAFQSCLKLVTMLTVQVILKIRYHLSGSGLLNSVDCPLVKPDQIFVMNYINELKFFFTIRPTIDSCVHTEVDVGGDIQRQKWMWGGN